MNVSHLLDGLQDALATGDARFHGVVIGIVTNNRDPEGLHRVKLRFPWLADGDESHWARVAAPMSGKGRGFYSLPEIDDEVLVAFEHASLAHPYVLGALWNGKDNPPENNGDGRNDHRSWTSRSGHVIRLNDAAGGETVEVVDKSGRNRIVIETSGNRIRIEADGDIEIASSAGRVKISGVGIDLDSRADVSLSAQTTAKLQSGATMSLSGALVQVNC